MTTKEAIKILHDLNKWRRGATIPMPDPTRVGIAIDQAIRVMRCELKRDKNKAE